MVKKIQTSKNKGKLLKNSTKKPSYSNKSGEIRATFVELFERETPLHLSKDESIYHNGTYNLYPNEIERVILNSPSGKASSSIFSKYIYGKGVENDIVVNNLKNYRLSNIVKIASVDIARHNGVFFHIGQVLQNGILKPVIDVLEYTKCRIGKADDNEFVSKFFYKDYTIEESQYHEKNNKKAYWYYAFDNSIDVILQQIRNDYFQDENADENADLATMLPSYRGQVYYMNLTPEFRYSLSPFDACYNDMDSEYRIGLYINRQGRKGFSGKTYVSTAGLDEEAQKNTAKNVEGWLGAKNSGGLYVTHFDNSVEDLEKVFKIGQIKPEFDDKLYAETKTTLRENIYSQANNVPMQLVRADSGMFGTQSATYIEMKRFYNEQTFEERKELEQTLDLLGFKCKIIPVIQE
jgi:hypothetical protein